MANSFSRKISRLIAVVLLGSSLAAQANIFQNQQQQQQILQQQRFNRNNQQGSVVGLMNRIPRNFDTQTLINTGPGLLQETYFLFRRFGGGNKNPEQTQPEAPELVTPTVESPQVQMPRVVEPQPPQVTPVMSPGLIHTSPVSKTDSYTSTSDYMYHETEDEKQELTKLPEINEAPMIPAPAPGYIIRYNQEKGVYEEVREINIR